MAYPVKIAAELAGLSVSGVKTYSARYKTFLSPSANPGPGLSRSYTPNDVALLKAIGALAKQGIPSAEILARLEAGELADLPPIDAAQNATEGPQQAPQQTAVLGLLAPVLQALQQRLDDGQRREDALHDRIAELERQLGQAQGELSQRRKPWYRRLFGG